MPAIRPEPRGDLKHLTAGSGSATTCSAGVAGDEYRKVKSIVAKALVALKGLPEAIRALSREQLLRSSSL